MSLFVLEIGSEELPARFLDSQAKELQKRFSLAFEENGVGYSTIEVLTSPRRAVVFVHDIQAVQLEKEEVVAGPPARIAMDEHGKPTKALEGFLRTNGVELKDIFLEETPKGSYVHVRKRSGGAKTTQLLEHICPAVISALPFPKKMCWGAQTFTYARPLRWILALFDDDVVPFSVGPVQSGNVSMGHRVHSQQEDGSIGITIENASEYLHKVRTMGFVEPDAAIRRQRIIDGGNTAAEQLNARVLWKDSLLDEVQGLCEHPIPVIGSFDPHFLEVPQQVLLTSMESHQKSFGLQNADGELLPYFLTVSNTKAHDMRLVQNGWERVLRARLEDARFFWNSDLTTEFNTWLEKLNSVIFIGALGSMGDKTRRIAELCSWLVDNCAVKNATSLPSKEDAKRAGLLSKADLVSGMVGEFDTLQGIMGGIYALKKGEKEDVATALQEQYLPAGPESAMPKTLLGAFLSMADKADTLVGCFGLNMIPTGTADPNALRRAALGIIRCLLEFDLNLDIAAFFKKAHELYAQIPWKLPADESLAKLQEFFHARLKNYWQGQGKNTLLVDSILAAPSPDVCIAASRLHALTKLHDSEQYLAAVQTFKRVSNIIRKQGQAYDLTGQYQHTLLQEAAEKALADNLDTILPRFDTLWQENDFDSIPQLLLDVRPAIDSFFDAVMVICDDEQLRINRLNLLKALTKRMEKFADFTALQI